MNKIMVSLAMVGFSVSSMLGTCTVSVSSTPSQPESSTGTVTITFSGCTPPVTAVVNMSAPTTAADQPMTIHNATSPIIITDLAGGATVTFALTDSSLGAKTVRGVAISSDSGYRGSCSQFNHDSGNMC